MGGLADGAPVRVLLADEQGIVRAGVRLILESEPGFAVVGETADGAAALRLFARLCDDPGVDVVLADLAAPAGGGAELARRVKAHRPGVRVLCLTSAMALGPCGRMKMGDTGCGRGEVVGY